MTSAVRASAFGRFRKSLVRASAMVPTVFSKSLEEEGKRIGEAMRDEGADAMPVGGGLSSRVRDAEVVVTRHAAPLGVWIDIGLRSEFDLQEMEDGNVHHPVFGNRKAWVDESVPAGAFTDGARMALSRDVGPIAAGGLRTILHTAATP